MLWAVIIAGGTGTRFWPASRRKTPKQFLKLFGGQTLFQQTLSRIKSLIPLSRTWVLTQDCYIPQVLKSASIPRNQILGEPVGRNTAPCAALAAAMILRKDPKAVIAILPSDQCIGKPALFRKLLRNAARAAGTSGWPVTFGIRPDCAHTGYGYLEISKKWPGERAAYRIKAFHEKPSFQKAQAYFKSGKYLWNSGMFVWQAGAMLQEVKKHLPAVDKIIRTILSAPKQRVGGDFALRFRRFYPKMPSISLDYGLMEKLRGKILTIPAAIEWCDLGGWSAYHDFCPQDKEGNAFFGKVLATASKGNFVKGQKRLVALVGVENLMIVDSPDALLIASKEKSQSIRDIVGQLEQKNWKQYL